MIEDLQHLLLRSDRSGNRYYYNKVVPQQQQQQKRLLSFVVLGDASLPSLFLSFSRCAVKAIAFLLTTTLAVG